MRLDRGEADGIGGGGARRHRLAGGGEPRRDPGTRPHCPAEDCLAGQPGAAAGGAAQPAPVLIDGLGYAGIEPDSDNRGGPRLVRAGRAADLGVRRGRGDPRLPAGAAARSELRDVLLRRGLGARADDQPVAAHRGAGGRPRRRPRAPPLCRSAWARATASSCAAWRSAPGAARISATRPMPTFMEGAALRHAAATTRSRSWPPTRA